MFIELKAPDKYKDEKNKAIEHQLYALAAQEINSEPEITLIDVLGNKYEIIAYSNFIDFYDSDNNYLKLNKIEDIFYYTKDEIVQYLDEFEEDLTGDLKHYDLIPQLII